MRLFKLLLQDSHDHKTSKRPFSMKLNLDPYLEEHLPYELSMLEHAFKHLQQPATYIGSRADFNVFLESFCVHARNLKNFITNDDEANRAVIARRFYDFDRRPEPKLFGAFNR